MNKFVQSALAAALLLTGSFSVSAQLSAGHILLTGSAGYSSSKSGTGDNSYTRTMGDISPQIGYFLAENLAVGIGISYGGFTTKDQAKSFNGSGTSARTTTTTAMVFGPFARYYKPVGERAAFFGQIDAGFGSSKRTEKLEGSNFQGQEAAKDRKYSLLSGGLMPGFTFFPTDHFGLEISMGGLSYNRFKPKDKPDGASDSWVDDNTETDLDFNFGLQQLLIGATWYLGGK